MFEGMPAILPELHSMDQNGQFHPYNEKMTNTANAAQAAAIAGRTMRTQFAGSSSSNFSRGFPPASKQNDVARSLDAVRATLQKMIDQEIHTTLQKYVKDYFEPAMENIRSNHGQDAVTETQVGTLLCRILDEARKMYEPALPPAPPPLIPATTAFGVDQVQEPFSRYGPIKARKNSDDSYSSAGSSVKRARFDKKRPAGPSRRNAEKMLPGEEFNSRDAKSIHAIDETTKFILGASANKILGYAAARGRIYVKYPNLFKYVGDQEDKQWLFENRVMTAAGGKAFLIIAEDVREILKLNEVTKDLVSDAHNFTVPHFMVEKIRAAASRYINSDTRSRSGSSVSNMSQNSHAITEADEDETDLERTSSVLTPPQQPISSPTNFVNNAAVRHDLFENTASPGDGFYDNLVDNQDVFNWV